MYFSQTLNWITSDIPSKIIKVFYELNQQNLEKLQ